MDQLLPGRGSVHPTEQIFHVTGLDPRSALCGRSGHIWAAPDWPPDDDMHTGLFIRCKGCDRQLTPVLKTALEKARNLELAAINAYKAGWREDCGRPAAPGEPTRTVADGLVQECRELGRRVYAEAARAVSDAQAAGRHPPSATLDDATTAAPR